MFSKPGAWGALGRSGTQVGVHMVHPRASAARVPPGELVAQQGLLSVSLASASAVLCLMQP